MLPNLKLPKHRLILASVVGLALVVIGLYWGGQFLGGVFPVPRQQDAEVAKQDPKIKISANTDITQTIIYLKCGDEEQFRTKPADNLVGLNLAQLQKVYGGWTVDKFDEQEVAMTLKVDSYCREHANNQFIGVHDGFVTVFYGRPGPRAIVKEVTRIPVERLSPADVTELERGLVIQSREEMLRTLEGLQSQ